MLTSRHCGHSRMLHPHFISRLLNYSNRPEITGKVRIHQIRIRYAEVPLHTPVYSPGISHNKPLRGVVIADREHGMAANLLFSWTWHRCVTALSHLLTHKAIVDGKPKDERIDGGPAAFHLVEVLDQACVASYLVLQSILIAFRRRLNCKLRSNIDIWPFGFSANSLLCYAFDAIPYHCAAI